MWIKPLKNENMLFVETLRIKPSTLHRCAAVPLIIDPVLIAAVIARHDGLKIATRVMLAPVVFAVVYPLGTGLFVLTAVAAAGCGLRIRHRSRERRP
jgi:hypothetical protein